MILNATRDISECNCPACRTYEIATRSWDVAICPIYMCLTVYEFSFILFDFCLFITIFIFILNHVLIVIFWIFTYYKIWILLNIYCFIWNYWIIYFVTCLEVFWSVMSQLVSACCGQGGPWLIKRKWGLCENNLGFLRSLCWLYFNCKSIRYTRYGFR